MKRLLLISLLTIGQGFFAAALQAASGCDGSGNCYVRAGASGSASGADWTNACTDLTVTACIPARGVTYYIATGLYGSQDWTAATSGTTMIYILRATVSSHGTATGWSNSYDGTVTFSWNNSNERAIEVETGYFDIDGITGSGIGASNYGFQIAAPGNSGGPTCSSFSGQAFDFTFGDPGGNGGTTSNVTVEHVGMTGCNGTTYDINTTAFGIGCGACYITNFTFEHNYSTYNNTYFDINNMSNSTMMYNIGDNFLTQPGIHAEVLAVTDNGSQQSACTSPCTENDVFAYNQIWNCRSSACMESVVNSGNTITMTDWQIYGNTIADDESGDGVFACNMQGTVIYQNTLISTGNIASNGAGGGMGNTIENNVFYATIPDYGGGITDDYNTYWNSSSTAPSETHGQVVSLTTCPLTNCSITEGTGNYNLATAPVSSCSSTTATCGGLSLSSPYNVDMNGNNYTYSGEVARGAFAYGISVLPALSRKGMFARVLM